MSFGQFIYVLPKLGYVRNAFGGPTDEISDTIAMQYDVGLNFGGFGLTVQPAYDIRMLLGGGSANLFALRLGFGIMHD